MAGERRSWLVGPKQEASLIDLRKRFEKDPETDITRIIGPPDDPSLLVVEMSDETAKRYRQQYQDEFNIEPNAPLHPLKNSS
jgi:hypothetical protein